MMIPEVAKKLYGSLNRTPSPSALDGAKPDGINAFAEMLDVLGQLSLDNLDPASDVPFEERLNPDVDVFSGKDPRELQRKAMS